MQQAAEIFAHAGVQCVDSHLFHVNNLQFSTVTFDKADRAIIQRAGAAAAFNKINGVPVSVISKGPWKYSPLWMLAELIHCISNRIQMDS
nr:Uncharacterised protein [Klebsiella pneumoniae]